MIIPRLAPSNNPISITITVNERLRPYFTRWYQNLKKDNESPEEFGLRKLKESAMSDYILFHTRLIEEERDDELIADTPVIISEVE